MSFLAWVAALVLFLQLPIPLFWFVLHPQVNFWRRHQNAGYITAVLLAWIPVTVGMILFRHALFRSDWPPAWNLAAGAVLILFEGWIFWRVQRDLGIARFVGKAELSGGGEVARRGIYACIRHPRYIGSFLAILGACFLAGTRMMWYAAAAWAFLTLAAIALEERELHTRFGKAYEEYCRAVPRFLPLRWKPHEG